MKSFDTYTPEAREGLEIYQNRLLCVELNTALRQIHEQQTNDKTYSIPDTDVIEREDGSLQLQTKDGTPIVRSGLKGLSNTMFIDFFVPGLRNRITKEQKLHQIQITSDEPAFRLVGEKKEFGYPENPIGLVNEINEIWAKQDSTSSDRDYIEKVYKTIYKQFSRDINSARIFLGLAVIATGAFVTDSRIGKTSSWFVRNLTEEGSFDEEFARLLDQMGLGRVKMEFSLFDHTISGNDLLADRGIIGELKPNFSTDVDARQLVTSTDGTGGSIQEFQERVAKYNLLGHGSSKLSKNLDNIIIKKMSQSGLEHTPIIATDGWPIVYTNINSIIQKSLGAQDSSNTGLSKFIEATPYLMEAIASSALIGKVTESALTQFLGFCSKDVRLTNIVMVSILSGTFVSMIETYYEKGIILDSSAAIVEADSEKSIAEKMYELFYNDDQSYCKYDDLVLGRNLIMALNTFAAIKVLDTLEHPPRMQFFAGFGHSEITGEFLKGEPEIVRQLEEYVSMITNNVTELYKFLIQKETDENRIQDLEYDLYMIMAELAIIFPPYIFGNRHIVESANGKLFPVSKHKIVTPQSMLIMAIRKKAQENLNNTYGQLLSSGISVMLDRTSSFLKKEPVWIFEDRGFFQDIKFHQAQGIRSHFNNRFRQHLSSIVGSAEVNGRELPLIIARKDSKTIGINIEAEGVIFEIGILHLDEEQSRLNGHIYNFVDGVLYSDVIHKSNHAYAQKVIDSTGTVPEFLRNASYKEYSFLN